MHNEKLQAILTIWYALAALTVNLAQIEQALRIAVTVMTLLWLAGQMIIHRKKLWGEFKKIFEKRGW